jgi:hypothetical protein
MMIAEIEDHRVLDDAIPTNDGYFTTTSVMKRKKRTPRGWEILVRWKDGSSDWIVLKDLKESYPVELANYAFAQGIQDEPVFAWWVPYVHKKRKSIIAKSKSKYWQRTHKYEIRVPRSIDEAKTIDETNGNTRWVDAVTLEMQNVRIEFEVFGGDTATLTGYQKISGHLVFDVKLGRISDARPGTVPTATRRSLRHWSPTVPSCPKIR